MSIFDFPRLNFKGKLRLNPGTANNEDYAQPGSGQALMPPTSGDYEGQALGLLQSKPVQVQRYGKDDRDFVEWIQKSQEFVTPLGKTESIIPAEWNYYGDMGATPLAIRVVGVQQEPGTVHTRPDDDVPLTRAIDSTLDFVGSITDINPEGSPPATQFFIHEVTLTSAGETFLTGGLASKGVGLWINFFRNVNLQQDDGSGSYVHHVIRGASVSLPGFESADGVVLRYYLSLPLLDDPSAGGRNGTKVIEEKYAKRETNPKTLDIVGTLAPYYEGDPMAMPVGRQLISRRKNVATPRNPNNNGMGTGIALAPAVLQQRGDRLTADFVGTFPDAYDAAATPPNPKFDLGPVDLRVVKGSDHAAIGPVDYTALAAGDASGWLFDFDLTDEARTLLEDPDATLELHSEQYATVLDEVDYYVVTDQLAVYGEQHGPEDRFLNQGTEETITVSVYHRGAKLVAGTCPPITTWLYDTVPIQSPGVAIQVTDDLAPSTPNTPIKVSTALPGAGMLTFRVKGETNPPEPDFPPQNYGAFAYPPGAFAVTWAPQISVRVLPNTDYSEHYEIDPATSQPVGGPSLTWEIVYDEVLRTYALLFPAMDAYFKLDDPDAIACHAQKIIDATTLTEAAWLSPAYMPRTRDLSATRRELLHAYCRKVMSKRTDPPAG